MPCWYFERWELNETPSQKGGVEATAEAKYRREGAKLIVDVGTALRLRYDVCATGVVYFHRFYMFHSFTDFHRYVVATSCLFLAAKMDESTITCDTVKKAVQGLLTQTQFTVFGNDPKQEILITEKILLEALKFDLIVEHPYSHLLKFIKLLKGDQETIEQLLKMSWTFINDSLCTTLCIQWEPDIIAISLLYLSCRLLKFRVTDWLDKPPDCQDKWYKFLVKGITIHVVEDVCRQVLDLYAGHSSQPSERKARSPQRRSSKSMSISPPSSSRRDRSPDKAGQRRRSRSRSLDRERRPSSPTKSGIMLSREAFENLQHLLRRQAGLEADKVGESNPPLPPPEQAPLPPDAPYQRPPYSQPLPPPGAAFRLQGPPPVMLRHPFPPQPGPFPMVIRHDPSVISPPRHMFMVAPIREGLRPHGVPIYEPLQRPLTAQPPPPGAPPPPHQNIAPPAGMEGPRFLGPPPPAVHQYPGPPVVLRPEHHPPGFLPRSMPAGTVVFQPPQQRMVNIGPVPAERPLPAPPHRF